MANAEVLYETLDEVLANLEVWNQNHYIAGKYQPAKRIAECGTTQCIAGFRGLMDGLLPARVHQAHFDDVDPDFVRRLPLTIHSFH